MFEKRLLISFVCWYSFAGLPLWNPWWASTANMAALPSPKSPYPLIHWPLFLCPQSLSPDLFPLIYCLQFRCPSFPCPQSPL
ncbi:hypothetical protein DL98DRAFT_191732 [Cadophora sp. DSE1049]|nr:hypothetical protein DL98DRAFT_191732 [Cadophora sp. DSE1049]